MAAWRSAIFCSVSRASSASRCWSSCVDALGLGRDDLAQRGRGLLAALAAGGDDDLARGRERDRVLGDAPFSSASRASTAWAASTIASVRLVRWASRSARVLASVALSSSFWRLKSGAQLVLELGQLLAGLAAAALGLLLELLAGRACARPRRRA